MSQDILLGPEASQCGHAESGDNSIHALVVVADFVVVDAGFEWQAFFGHLVARPRLERK